MSGYRVYITAKDYELLVDLLRNDVYLSDDDEREAEKEAVIDKLLHKGE